MSFYKKVVEYLYRRYMVDGGEFLALNKKTRQSQNRQDLLNCAAIFLITPGRSGTKSLIEFCKRYSDFYSVHAPEPWLASTSYVYHQGALSFDAAAAAFYAARESYLRNAFERDAIFFDGDCKSLPLSPVIAQVMPNSKFLHVVRNPKSFIKSGLVRGYYEDKAPEMWGHLMPVEGWESYSQIEKIAYFWNEANVIAEKLKSRLGPSRVQTLVADQMFKSQDVILSAFNALGVSDFIHVSNGKGLERLNSQRGVDNFDQKTLEDIDTAIESLCGTKALYFQ